MIKVECSNNTGSIIIKGDPNIIFNELEQLVKYMVMYNADTTLEAISNGIVEASEAMKNEKN